MSKILPRPHAALKTVDVILAAAAAREDLRFMRELVARRFEFRLLAAAEQEEPALPAAGWPDLRQRMRAQVRPAADGLSLTLQAEGYETLRRVAGHQARLSSPDGALDVGFRFDGDGHGLVVIADTPAVRSALAVFRVLVEA